MIRSRLSRSCALWRQPPRAAGNRHPDRIPAVPLVFQGVARGAARQASDTNAAPERGPGPKGQCQLGECYATPLQWTYQHGQGATTANLDQCPEAGWFSVDEAPADNLAGSGTGPSRSGLSLHGGGRTTAQARRAMPADRGPLSSDQSAERCARWPASSTRRRNFRATAADPRPSHASGRAVNPVKSLIQINRSGTAGPGVARPSPIEERRVLHAR